MRASLLAAPCSTPAHPSRSRCSAAAATATVAPVKHVSRQNGSMQTCQQLEAICDAVQAVAPLPAQQQCTAALHEKLDLVYDALEEVFFSKRGYAISAKERRLIEATGGHPTYGELMPKGIDSMLAVMTGGQPCGAGTVFADLGSGLGRVCLQAALTQPFNRFDAIVGAELSPSRLEQSESAREALLELHDGDAARVQALSKVQFVGEDVTHSKVLEKATHVFCCNTAFSSVACRKIVEQLYASSVFQVLITSRELPFQPYLIKLGDFPCETSWNAAGTGHVYVRHDLRNAPAHLLRRYLSDGGLCWLPTATNHPHLPVAAQEPVEGFKVQWLETLQLA